MMLPQSQTSVANGSGRTRSMVWVLGLIVVAGLGRGLAPVPAFAGTLDSVASADEKIAQLSEKLELESREMKQRINELVQAGLPEEAERMEQALRKMQASLERQIRKRKARLVEETPARPFADLEHLINELRMERERAMEALGPQHPRIRKLNIEIEARQRKLEAMHNPVVHPDRQFELQRDGHPGPDQHLRELHERIAIAIKQRQPDRVVELGHQIAELLHRQPHDPALHDGPQHDGPQHDGPRHDGPRHDGPRHDGPRHDGPRHDGPRHDGPRPDGPRPDGPRPDGPRPDGWREEEPRHAEEHPRDRGPGGLGPDFLRDVHEMIGQLRAELHQLRRELEEVRRERR